MRMNLRTAALAVVLAMGSAGLGFSGAAAAGISKAEFSADGQVRIPKNWRQWVYVGTPLTPNALNDGKVAFPEFHNVYMEPSAYAHWVKTGDFAEGTQLAKELVLIRQKPGEMEPNGSTAEVSGVGYFQGEFQGLELTIKDNERFSDQPGGWAYFSFGHKAPPYAQTATAFPAESCNACHEASAAKDFVFTQFYPVLRVK
ncbi:MAG: cytochrome P460 family protein [Alphaproteobacteria bacterium]